MLRFQLMLFLSGNKKKPQCMYVSLILLSILWNDWFDIHRFSLNLSGWAQMISTGFMATARYVYGLIQVKMQDS